jgi:hypothetical protein
MSICVGYGCDKGRHIKSSGYEVRHQKLYRLGHDIVYFGINSSSVSMEHIASIFRMEKWSKKPACTAKTDLQYQPLVGSSTV